MCPGGTVVAAASEPDSVVTNGMSYYARDGRKRQQRAARRRRPGGFWREHPLAGMFLQREIERRAFVLGGEAARLPARPSAICSPAGASGKLGVVEPSYKPGRRPL